MLRRRRGKNKNFAGGRKKQKRKLYELKLRRKRRLSGMLKLK